MIELDGRLGEGGGQILRSSLALSMITGKEFHLFNIRAGRKKPGLQPQHLTCVLAAAEVSRADLNGAKLQSSDLTFRPRPPSPGEYRFAIGTAGSTSLVLQTVLPALLTVEGPSKLAFEGGTHNDHAPPFDFLERTFLPLLNQMGPVVRATLDRPGFYPVGRGKVRVEIEPTSRLGRLELTRRGDIREVRLRAIVSRLPRHIAEREVAAMESFLQPRLRTLGISPRPEIVEENRSSGPGNACLVEIDSGSVTEVFAGFGARGVPAEKVAEAAAVEAGDYLDAGAPVGPHLADQLLLPLALGAGGSFLTSALTEHTRTNADVIRRFLDGTIDFSHPQENQTLVQVGQPADAAGPNK